jgi:hypothetical protein
MTPLGNRLSLLFNLSLRGITCLIPCPRSGFINGAGSQRYHSALLSTAPIIQLRSSERITHAYLLELIGHSILWSLYRGILEAQYETIREYTAE